MLHMVTVAWKLNVTVTEPSSQQKMKKERKKTLLTSQAIEDSFIRIS